MIDMSGIERIVIRLPNWIGDAVMALPAVNCIKSSFPQLHVSCLGKPSVNELYKYNRNVDRLIDLRLPEGIGRLSGIKAFSRGLRKYDFDLGLILPNSFSSALIFKLGGVRRRLGYRFEMRSFLLTDSVRLPTTSIHRSQRYVRLVQQLSGIEDCAQSIQVIGSEKESNAADHFLAGMGRFAVVCPTSRAPSRRWGRQKYAELAKRLADEHGLGVVLAGAADESSIVDEVGRLSGTDYLNLAEENDLLLSIEVMRRSEVFIGNDSGAAHLAAASGTRVVSISGADNPHETRPLAQVSAIVNKRIDCSPCVKNVCPREDHVNECMDVISVDDVLSEVAEIMGHKK
jgi:heptosyltransferase-2